MLKWLRIIQMEVVADRVFGRSAENRITFRVQSRLLSTQIPCLRSEGIWWCMCHSELIHVGTFWLDKKTGWMVLFSLAGTLLSDWTRNWVDVQPWRITTRWLVWYTIMVNFWAWILHIGQNQEPHIRWPPHHFSSSQAASGATHDTYLFAVMTFFPDGVTARGRRLL